MFWDVSPLIWLPVGHTLSIYLQLQGPVACALGCCCSLNCIAFVTSLLHLCRDRVYALRWGAGVLYCAEVAA